MGMKSFYSQVFFFFLMFPTLKAKFKFSAHFVDQKNELKNAKKRKKFTKTKVINLTQKLSKPF